MELKTLLEKVLLEIGFMSTRLTKKKRLDAFFNLIKPTPIIVELIRLGGQGDGGYLVPNDLENIEACFSPGVSTVADFEEEISKYGIKSFMIDYSVDSAPHYNPLFDFEKKWLGIGDGTEFIRLEDWVYEKCPDSTGDLMLQMDIEGAEFELVPAIAPWLEKHRPVLYLSTHAPHLPESQRRQALTRITESLDFYPRVEDGRGCETDSLGVVTAGLKDYEEFLFLPG